MTNINNKQKQLTFLGNLKKRTRFDGSAILTGILYLNNISDAEDNYIKYDKNDNPFIPIVIESKQNNDSPMTHVIRVDTYRKPESK